MKYSEFLDCIEKSELKTDLIYQGLDSVLKFFYVYKNQKSYINITNCDEYIPQSVLSIYKQYGIYFNSLVGMKEFNILYLEPDKDMKSQIKEQTELISESAVFTHLVVNTDDMNVLNTVYNKFLEEFGDLMKLNLCQRKSDIDLDQQALNLIKEKLHTDKIFDLTPYLAKLSKMDRNNFDFFATYKSMIQEIAEKSKGLIPVCPNTNEYFLDFLTVTSELYLNYNIASYVPYGLSTSYTSTIQVYLNSLDFNLAENVIDYYKKLPLVMIDLSKAVTSYHFLGKTSVKAVVKSIKISDLESNLIVPTQTIVDFDLVTLLSVDDFADLATVEGCNAYKEILLQFSKKLGITYVDYTKVIYYLQDGISYISYLESNDNLTVTCQSCAISSVGSTIVQLDIKGLSSLLPLDLFLGGTAVAAAQWKKLKQTPFNKSFVTPVKHYTHGGTMLSSLVLNVNTKWTLEAIPLRDYGLLGKNSKTVRQGFAQSLIPLIGAKNYISSCDVFGGYDPRLSQNIILE